MNYLGVDYSMSCPGVCLNGNKFAYVHSDKKLCGNFSNNLVSVDGIHYNKNDNNDDNPKRFAEIGMRLYEWLGDIEPGTAFFEDYAYGRVGRGLVFNIAENTGFFKSLLAIQGWKIETVAPTEAKKHATGGGKADKTLMCESFTKLNFDFETIMPKKAKNGQSPIADIVDAYYMLATGLARME